MTKILVTGANGQLGQSFRLVADQFPKFQLLFIDLPEVDLLNIRQLQAFFKANPVHFVINCAAYTSVDQAEDEVELTFETNLNIVSNLCELSQRFQFKIVQLSTDYVFDGLSKLPLSENSNTNPINEYGSSKLKGEQVCLKNDANAIIIRTTSIPMCVQSFFEVIPPSIAKVTNKAKDINNAFH